jgi:hypothetical protein
MLRYQSSQISSQTTLENPKIEIDLNKISLYFDSRGLSFWQPFIMQKITLLGTLSEGGRYFQAFSGYIKINSEIDLIEHLIRLIGFDKLIDDDYLAPISNSEKIHANKAESYDQNSHQSEMQSSQQNNHSLIEKNDSLGGYINSKKYKNLVSIRNFLAKSGFLETVTRPFVEEDGLILENSAIKLINPNSSLKPYFRDNLVFSQLEVIAAGLQKGYKNQPIFEIAKVYHLEKSGANKHNASNIQTKNVNQNQDQNQNRGQILEKDIEKEVEGDIKHLQNGGLAGLKANSKDASSTESNSKEVNSKQTSSDNFESDKLFETDSLKSGYQIGLMAFDLDPYFWTSLIKDYLQNLDLDFDDLIATQTENKFGSGYLYNLYSFEGEQKDTQKDTQKPKLSESLVVNLQEILEKGGEDSEKQACTKECLLSFSLIEINNKTKKKMGLPIQKKLWSLTVNLYNSLDLSFRDSPKYKDAGSYPKIKRSYNLKTNLNWKTLKEVIQKITIPDVDIQLNPLEKIDQQTLFEAVFSADRNLSKEEIGLWENKLFELVLQA